MAAILKFKNTDLAGICANVNIDFQIFHALSFPKIYRFANPHKILTKVHSKPDSTTVLYDCTECLDKHPAKRFAVTDGLKVGVTACFIIMPIDI